MVCKAEDVEDDDSRSNFPLLDTDDISSIIALPILGMAPTRVTGKRLLAIAAITVALFRAALVQYPSLVGTLEGFAKGGTGSNVTSDTALSLILSGYPFLRYVAVEITSDSSTAFLLLMAAVGAYYSPKARRPLFLLPLVWLLAIAAASPPNEGAWRFSYAGLLPLCLLASFGFVPFVARTQASESVSRCKGGDGLASRRALATFLPMVVLLLVVGGTSDVSRRARPESESNRRGATARHLQLNALAGNQHALRQPGHIDYRFEVPYTDLIKGCSSGYSPLTTPDDVQLRLNETKNVYMAATAVATLSEESSISIQDQASGPHFQKVYNNVDVRIYRMNVAAEALAG